MPSNFMCLCVCVCVRVCVCVCVCVFKMIVKITKDTWESCRIKTIKYFNEETNKIELWLKTSDIKEKLTYSNIADFAPRRIRKYWGKK